MRGRNWWGLSIGYKTQRMLFTASGFTDASTENEQSAPESTRCFDSRGPISIIRCTDSRVEATGRQRDFSDAVPHRAFRPTDA